MIPRHIEDIQFALESGFSVVDGADVEVHIHLGIDGIEVHLIEPGPDGNEVIAALPIPAAARLQVALSVLLAKAVDR